MSKKHLLPLLALLMCAAPTKAAILISQTDDTGTPVQLGLNQQLDDPATLSFIAPHTYPAGSMFWIKLKGSISDPNYPLGNWTSFRLTDSPINAGAYGYTDYAGTGGLGYGCMNPTGTSAPDQVWNCTATLGVGITEGMKTYGILQETNYPYYMRFTSDTSILGAPYLQVSDSPGEPFYSQISNESDGYGTIYATADSLSTPLKQLPNGWTVLVSKTSDASGNTILNDSAQWYSVTDPTDGTVGWMKGANAAASIEYLPFYKDQQIASVASSTDIILPADRPVVIESAIDHYYNNEDTESSLYSSDDVPGYEISRLSGYPEQLILGIAARESGDIGPDNTFDNQNVTSDFGHGIMQVTFYPSEFDNRGLVSHVVLPQCSSGKTELYKNCYSSPDTTSPNYRHYIEDDSLNGITGLTFREYTNTLQSIYSNIKDGMGLLSAKYARYGYVASSKAVGGITYSANDVKDILATENYNGSDLSCGYVDKVATKLDHLREYFPTSDTSTITDLIEKMHAAGKNEVCASLHSPGEITISDTAGHVAGIVKGNGTNTFPLAVYDEAGKFVKILATESGDVFSYAVTGTANSTYDLVITVKNGSQETTFSAVGIPTTIGQIHTYSVDTTALMASSSSAVSVTIDSTGTGTDVKTIQVGSTVTGTEFSQAISQATSTQSVSSSTAPVTPIVSETSSSTDATTTSRIDKNYLFWLYNQIKIDYFSLPS